MILRAAVVAPVCGPPIDDGFVAIEGNRIVALGAVADAPDAITHDLGQVLLLPGLINPHTHLELTCYHGTLAPGPFWEWVLALVGHRQQEGAAAQEAEGLQRGAWESLRAGVTTVGDISRRGDSWRVLQHTPLRATCFAELLTFAAEPARTVEELQQQVAGVPQDGRLQAGVSPHATYSVRPDDIAPAVATGRPWTMHVAETTEETAFLAGQPTLPPGLLALAEKFGIAPEPGDVAAYLERYVPADRPGALVHMNYLTDEDIAWLAGSSHTVVYCPRAHRFFGHTPHPLPQLLQSGVRVALGTDSKASNDSLSVLEEAAFVLRERPDACTPTQLIEMITIASAAALARTDIGSLQVGHLADLVAFPLPSGGDAFEFLLREAPLPEHVWVDGQLVDFSSDASPVSNRSD